MTNAYIDSLISSKEANIELINTRLAEILANPQPSYSIDGETWNLTDYQDMLFRNQKNEIDAIISLQKMKNIFNPYLIKSVFR